MSNTPERDSIITGDDTQFSLDWWDLSIDIPSEILLESPAPLDFAKPVGTLDAKWMAEVPGDISDLITLNVPETDWNMPAVSGTASILGLVDIPSMLNNLVIPENMEEDKNHPWVYIENTEKGFSIFRVIDGSLKKLTPKNYYQKPEFNKAWLVSISDESGTIFIKLIWNWLREFHSENKLSTRKHNAWFVDSDLEVLVSEFWEALVHISDTGLVDITNYDLDDIKSTRQNWYMVLRSHRKQFHWKEKPINILWKKIPLWFKWKDVSQWSFARYLPGKKVDITAVKDWYIETIMKTRKWWHGYVERYSQWWAKSKSVDTFFKWTQLTTINLDTAPRLDDSSNTTPLLEDKTEPLRSYDQLED